MATPVKKGITMEQNESSTALETPPADTEEENGEPTEENGEEEESEESLNARGVYFIRASTTNKAGEKVSIRFPYFFGVAIQDAINEYGAGIVNDLYQTGLESRGSAIARRKLGAGESVASIEAFMKEWRPEVSQPRGFQKVTEKSVLEHMRANVKDYSKETLEEAIALLTGDFPGGIEVLEAALAKRRAAANSTAHTEVAQAQPARVPQPKVAGKRP